jgi:hypothetical protein
MEACVPDGNITSGIPYPTFNPPQQNALISNPAAAIGVLGELQKLNILRQQAPALGQIPAATLANTNLANTTARLEQQAGAQKRVAAGMGALLQGIPNPTSDDVHSATAYFARSNPDIATQFPDMIPAAADLIIANPRGIKNGAGLLLNSALSPGEASSRVAGPPMAGSGAPTTISVPQANLGGPQGIVTGNPPGFQERQAGAADLDTRLAGGLGEAAEGSPARRAILGNLEDALTNFTTGPGADWTKVAKAFVNRNVPLPQGWQFDPKSIASQEEFVKQAGQLAQQQFAAIGGTGTDAKFSSAYQTNPNDTLSQLGNRGIIRLLKGNEDALQAKNAAWINASTMNPNLSYRAFSQYFNSQFDPRVFQFKYMSKTDRNAYVAKMSPDDYERLMHDIGAARRQNWINY